MDRRRQRLKARKVALAGPGLNATDRFPQPDPFPKQHRDGG